MVDPTLVQQLLDRYPVLARLPRPAFEHDLASLPTIHVPAGTIVFDAGEPCRGFPLVIDGDIRVARGVADGRALELYRVGPGEICVVSAGCLFGDRPMNARGIARTDSWLMVASAECIRRWTDDTEVRDFMFGLLAERLADLMELVEAVAFHRLDQRLARALLGHGPSRIATHQQIASELGTAREMVSRLLKRFESEGLVMLGRERVDIVDLPRLRHLAGDQ